MNRIGVWLAWLVWAAPSACGVDGAPQDSSGSHWLRCDLDEECTPFDPEAVCAEGYCEDEFGERLVESDGITSSSSLQGQGGEPQAGSGGQPAPAGGGRPATAGAGGAMGGDGPEPSADTPPSALPAECPPLPAALESENVFEGDYVITGQGSIDAAALFTEISGSISFAQRATGDLALVELPGLERVGGSLLAAQSQLSRLILPRLASIGGDLVLSDDPALIEADFPSLSRIDGDLTVGDNPLLVQLSLPALGTVSGSVGIGPSSLANCQVQGLFDALEFQATYSEGRDDCSCDLVCQRWTATCP